MTFDMYDRTCHECFEPIPSDSSMVTSPSTGRRWHVMCAPPVEDDEPRKKPRLMVQPDEPGDRRRKPGVTTGGSHEGWRARRDARLLVARGVFLPE